MLPHHLPYLVLVLEVILPDIGCAEGGCYKARLGRERKEGAYTNEDLLCRLQSQIFGAIHWSV